MSSGGFWVGYGRGGQVSCGVCHDPHGSTSPYALARVISGADTTGTAGGNPVGAPGCGRGSHSRSCHTWATTF